MLLLRVVVRHKGKPSAPDQEGITIVETPHNIRAGNSKPPAPARKKITRSAKENNTIYVVSKHSGKPVADILNNLFQLMRK